MISGEARCAPSDFTVVVTRPEEQSAELIAMLEQAGFQTLLLPLIAIEPLVIGDEEKAILSRFSAGFYSWITFGSVNGVAAFSAALEQCGGQGIPAATSAAVVGSKTGAAFERRFGHVPDLVPESFTAEGLLQALVDRTAGARVLIVRAAGGREVLADGLTERGVEVDELTLYRSAPRQPGEEVRRKLLLLDPARLIVSFFSPSAFKAALGFFGEQTPFLRRTRIATVGPVTSAAVRKAGYLPAIEAGEHTSEGFLRALCAGVKQ